MNIVDKGKKYIRRAGESLDNGIMYVSEKTGVNPFAVKGVLPILAMGAIVPIVGWDSSTEKYFQTGEYVGFPDIWGGQQEIDHARHYGCELVYHLTHQGRGGYFQEIFQDWISRF
jgi:muramidase (phage lysozyme)